jgi:hypothetical protein
MCLNWPRLSGCNDCHHGFAISSLMRHLETELEPLGALYLLERRAIMEVKRITHSAKFALPTQIQNPLNPSRSSQSGEQRLQSRSRSHDRSPRQDFPRACSPRATKPITGPDGVDEFCLRRLDKGRQAEEYGCPPKKGDTPFISGVFGFFKANCFLYPTRLVPGMDRIKRGGIVTTVAEILRSLRPILSGKRTRT